MKIEIILNKFHFYIEKYHKEYDGIDTSLKILSCRYKLLLTKYYNNILQSLFIYDEYRSEENVHFIVNFNYTKYYTRYWTEII